MGGAYSFLPLIEKEVVQKYNWLSKKEFLDVLSMVKIFPGAISIKYATYTGYKIAGIRGALAANIGNFLAPALLIGFASLIYLKYKERPQVKNAFNMIELAVFAMLIAMAFQTVTIEKLIQARSLLVIILVLSLFLFTKIEPALIIICAGILGILLK